MTKNVEKVLNCLIKKKNVDVRNGQENCGWMMIRDITAECLFKKYGSATGCVVLLMRSGIVEVKEEITLDNKIHKFYRVKDTNCSAEMEG